MNDFSDQEPLKIHWRIPEWFPKLTPSVLADLSLFHQELLRLSKTMSLISAKTLGIADQVHFADSILACQAIMDSNPNIKSIHDFGTGNGFPGLIFAIMFPNVQTHLVELDRRKYEYLNSMVNQLGLKNVSVHSKSAETFTGLQYGMCRGFATITKTCMQLRKSFDQGGIIYHLKSEEWSMEVADMPTQLCAVWSPSLLSEYSLPAHSIRHTVVKTTKL